MYNLIQFSGVRPTASTQLFQPLESNVIASLNQSYLTLNGYIMKPQIALVRFVRETAYHVVSVKKILNFAPKSDKDFQEKKIYEVYWPILKREDSTTSTTEETFQAYILILAGKFFLFLTKSPFLFSYIAPTQLS